MASAFICWVGNTAFALRMGHGSVAVLCRHSECWVTGFDTQTVGPRRRHYKCSGALRMFALRMLGHGVCTEHFWGHSIFCHLECWAIGFGTQSHGAGTKTAGTHVRHWESWVTGGTQKAGPRAALRKPGHDDGAQKGGSRRWHLECWATASALRKPGYGVVAQNAGPRRRHLEFQTESKLCHSYSPIVQTSNNVWRVINQSRGGERFHHWALVRGGGGGGKGGGVRKSSQQI
jgi:hypothetical protein